MSLRDAAAIDKNFSTPKSVAREGLIYYDAKEFDVYGVTHVDGIYRRMPYEVAKRVSEQVALISTECAGGRVRFTTDSPYIAIFVKYRSVSKVPNYSYTATMGFDLYAQKRSFKRRYARALSFGARNARKGQGHGVGGQYPPRRQRFSLYGRAYRQRLEKSLEYLILTKARAVPVLFARWKIMKNSVINIKNSCNGQKKGV